MKFTKQELNDIADKMAERYGLQVSEVDGKREVNGRKFVLWDDEHKTEIDLSTVIQRQDEVDFTNRGYYNAKNGGQYESTYTLDEVLSYYNEMPNIMKDATGGILFKGQGSAYNTVVEGRVNNPILITHNFLKHTDWFSPKGKDSDLQRVLYHEGSHAIEENLTSKQYEVMRKANTGKGRFSIMRLDTQEERDIYNDIIYKDHNPQRYIFSDTENYDNGMGNNKVKFGSNYGKRVFRSRRTQSKRCEDFADTMSMVVMSRTSRSEIAVLENNGVNQFKQDHEATWKYCEDILDGKVKANNVTRIK